MRFTRSIILFLVGIFYLSAQALADKHALLIGIDEYQDRDNVSPLAAAANDARSMAKALADLCGFQKDHIRLLVSDGENKPTRANIVFELSQLETRVKSGDIVFILYSGHGIEMGGTTYLLPWDIDNRNDVTLRSSALAVSDVLVTLQRLPARALIMTYDMCRNDPTQRGAREVRYNTLGKRQATRDLVLKKVSPGSGPRAVVTLFSCSPGQRSWEWRTRKRGFYSFFMEEGLRSGAADTNGVVRLPNLISYLERAVPGAVQREMGKEQTPYSIMDGTGIYDLILAEGRQSDGDSGSVISSKKQQFDALFQQGYELYQKKRHTAARYKFKEALQLDPNSSPAYNMLGLCYFELKEYTEAEPQYRQAMRLDPRSSAPVNNLATLAFNRGNIEEAERLYLQARDLEPAQAWIPRNLGLIYYRKKQYDRAEEQFRTAMDLDPKLAIPVNDLATLLLDIKKDYDRAKKLYEKAIELDPDEPSYRKNLDRIKNRR